MAASGKEEVVFSYISESAENDRLLEPCDDRMLEKI